MSRAKQDASMVLGSILSMMMGPCPIHLCYDDVWLCVIAGKKRRLRFGILEPRETARLVAQAFRRHRPEHLIALARITSDDWMAA